jgi:hypothetical protein
MWKEALKIGHIELKLIVYEGFILLNKDTLVSHLPLLKTTFIKRSTIQDFTSRNSEVSLYAVHIVSKLVYA